MTGQIIVSYVVENLSDHKTMTLQQLLEFDSVKKAIIKEMGGKRNSVFDSSNIAGQVTLSNRSEVFTLEINKDDFADALTFAEDDAKNNKRLSGDKVVTLIDLQTKE